jgi:hypothetical protein
MRPDRAELEHVVKLVESAKGRLVEAIPSPRGVQRTSVADALLAFETGLQEAAAAMADRDEAWEPLVRAVQESLRGAQRLRLEAPPLDYESLVTALGDLMSPLDAFDRPDYERDDSPY